MGKNPLQVIKGGLSSSRRQAKNGRNLVCEHQVGEEMMEINGGDDANKEIINI